MNAPKVESVAAAGALADTGDEGCRAGGDCADGQACRSGRCVAATAAAELERRLVLHAPANAPPAKRASSRRVAARWLGVRCDSDNQCAVSDSQGQRTPWRLRLSQCRVGPFGSCESDQACSGTLTCRTAEETDCVSKLARPTRSATGT